MARKALMTLLIVGVVGTLAGIGTFAAFSSTTANAGNSFAAGTVYISDNDSDAAMYSVSNQKPGESVTKCIKVTYTGSLASTVKLYASSVAAVGQYVDLTITPGTQTSSTFPDCTGFTADSGGAVYTGTLKGFADTHGSYAGGLSLSGPSAANWSQNNAYVYRFELTLQDNNSANGADGGALSSGSHSFTWEARNA